MFKVALDEQKSTIAVLERIDESNVVQQKFLKLPINIIKFIIDYCNLNTKLAFKACCKEFKYYVNRSDYLYYLVLSDSRKFDDIRIISNNSRDEYWYGFLSELPQKRRKTTIGWCKSAFYRLLGIQITFRITDSNFEVIGKKQIIYDCPCVQKAVKQYWFYYHKHLMIQGRYGFCGVDKTPLYVIFCGLCFQTACVVCHPNKYKNTTMYCCINTNCNNSQMNRVLLSFGDWTCYVFL